MRSRFRQCSSRDLKRRQFVKLELENELRETIPLGAVLSPSLARAAESCSTRDEMLSTRLDFKVKQQSMRFQIESNSQRTTSAHFIAAALHFALECC